LAKGKNGKPCSHRTGPKKANTARNGMSSRKGDEKKKGGDAQRESNKRGHQTTNRDENIDLERDPQARNSTTLRKERNEGDLDTCAFTDKKRKNSVLHATGLQVISEDHLNQCKCQEKNVLKAGRNSRHLRQGGEEKRKKKRSLPRLRKL